MPKQRRGKDGLSDRERDFCYQYILSKYDGQKAAIAAGYSPKSANEQASKMLKREPVIAKIDELRQKHFDKLDLTVEHIAEELGCLAFSDITNLVNIAEDGVTLRTVEDMGPATRTIQSIEIDDSRQNVGTKKKPAYVGSLKTKLKMHDKKGSLELLGKWRKMFLHIIEHGGSIETHQAEAADEAYRRRFDKTNKKKKSGTAKKRR